MTLPAQTLGNLYDGNGGTLPFAYTFKCLSSANLAVYLIVKATGVKTKKVEGTHYTVTGVGDDGGGSVIFITAPTALEQVFIYSETPLEQNTAYVEGDKFPANSHEAALDNLMRIHQERKGDVDRTIRAPSEDLTSSLLLPGVTLRAEKFLYFGTDGSLAVGDPESIVSNANAAAASALMAQGLAEDARDDAEDARDAAIAAQNLSQEWAENPEDDPITGHPGEFSAYHWSKKAEAVAGGGIVKVSADDTTPGYLETKLTLATNSGLVFATTSPAGDERRTIGIDTTVLSRRNRLCNGDFRVDNINGGAAVTPAATGYVVDNAIVSISQASKLAFQQQANIFPFSLRAAVSSAFVSPGAADYFVMTRFVEGLDWKDMMWGTANALPCTVSFDIIVSVAGTYGFGLGTPAAGKSYLFTKTLAANTLTHCTETIPGCTDGTWGAANNRALRLNFDLGSGSDKNGTDRTWETGNTARTSGCVSFVSNAGATYDISNVQIEKGSFSTPFEVLPYQQAEAWARRYRKKVTPQGIAYATSTTEVDIMVGLGDPMRTAASMVQSAVAVISNTSTDYTQSSVSIASVGNTNVGEAVHIRLGNFTGLTAGLPYIYRHADNPITFYCDL